LNWLNAEKEITV